MGVKGLDFQGAADAGKPYIDDQTWIDYVANWDAIKDNENLNFNCEKMKLITVFISVVLIGCTSNQNIRFQKKPKTPFTEKEIHVLVAENILSQRIEESTNNGWLFPKVCRVFSKDIHCFKYAFQDKIARTNQDIKSVDVGEVVLKIKDLNTNITFLNDFQDEDWNKKIEYYFSPIVMDENNMIYGVFKEKSGKTYNNFGFSGYIIYDKLSINYIYPMSNSCD